MVDVGAGRGETETRNRPPDPDELPDPDRVLPGLVLYSHSRLMYWWPVWLYSFIAAAISYVFGRQFSTDDGRIEYIYPQSGLGITFIVILLLVIIITNVRLRGIYSVTALLGGALVIVGLGWLQLLDDVIGLVPKLSIYLSAGFYATLAVAMFVIWALAFFVFDRLSYWRIRPGQLTKERMIGGGEQSFDTRGMLFEKHGEDYFRHILLGLGSGDLQLTTAGAREMTISIPNVLLVDRRVSQIQRLIAIKPDDLM